MASNEARLVFQFEDKGGAQPAQAAPQSPSSVPGVSPAQPGQTQSGPQQLAAGHAAKAVTGGGSAAKPVSAAPQAAVAPAEPADDHLVLLDSAEPPAGQPQASGQPQAGPQGRRAPPRPRETERSQPPQRKPPKQPQPGMSVVGAAGKGVQAGLAAGASIAGGLLSGSPALAVAGVANLASVGSSLFETGSRATEHAQNLADQAASAEQIAAKAAARADRLKKAQAIIQGSQGTSKAAKAAAVGRTAQAVNQAHRAAQAASASRVAASAAGAAASTASMAGPAAAVAGAVAGGLALGSFGVYKGLEVPYSAMRRARDQLEAVSGDITGARAMSEVRQILQDLRSAQRLGPGLGRMTGLEGQINVNLQRARDVLIAPLIDIANRILSVAGRGLGKLADFLEAHGDEIEALIKWLFEVNGAGLLSLLTKVGERWLGKDDKEKTSSILEWFEAQPHLGHHVHDAEFLSTRPAAFPGIMGAALEFGLGVF